MEKTLIVIQGPTGVGKTHVAISVAQHFGLPVINADSRQIFAEIPIGTAAPTPQEQALARHFFVGSHHISDYYSAAMYEHDVLQLLEQLYRQSDLALMAGGSMMYIDAVCKGIDDIPTIDSDTRAMMHERLEKEGLEALVDELRRLDYEHWLKVDRQNTRRVVHALEICHMTGKTYTSFLTQEKKQRPFRILKVGLTDDRTQLYEHINARVLRMVDEGLIDEARAVYPQRELNALNTVGYKELFAAFDGDIPMDEAIRRIQSNTRQYCRKQQTWLKRDADIKWFHPSNVKEIINYIETSIKN